MKKNQKSIKLLFVKSNIISIIVLILLMYIFIYNTASTLLINSYNIKLTEILNIVAIDIEHIIEITALNWVNYLNKSNTPSKHISIEEKFMDINKYNSGLITASGIIKEGIYIPDNSGIKPVDLSIFLMNNSRVNKLNDNFYISDLNTFMTKDNRIFNAISIIIPYYIENTSFVFILNTTYIKEISVKLINSINDFKYLFFNDRQNNNIFSLPKNNTTSLQNSRVLKHTNKSGFTIILIPDYSLMIQDIKDLRISLLVLLLFFIIFTFIQKSFLSNKIYIPIKRLIELMNFIGTGHFNIKLIDRSWKEIESLSRQIDLMIERINSLSKEIYSNKLLAIQTEIRTLQSQINPHFLFNTLNTMKMMAVKNKTDITIKIINLLSEMLHYGIYDANRTVPICDELKNVKIYIKLIEYRFDKKINLVINCPEELLKKQTLKLILQPVIENSIKHGFSDIDSAEISITVLKKYTSIVFIIKDNGNGISEKTLKQLLENLKDKNISDHSSSIGLINVKNRIALKYGTSYGLDIYSSGANGTTIKISIEDLI